MSDKPQISRPAAFVVSIFLGVAVFLFGAAIAVVGGLWP